MTIQQIQESAAYLRSRGFEAATAGIILGSGLGKLVHQVEDTIIIPYSEIPHFPLSTVTFHEGNLIFGTIAGKKVILMQGRFHLYEGYAAWQITYPLRVMHAIGIENLLVSNAAGALNPALNKGDIMLIEDHINMMGDSPLNLPNINDFGERFVDMYEPYSVALRQQLSHIAEQKNIHLPSGVYVALLGPQLETKAEYRFLRLIGADAVGMSTVPEAIVAKQLQIPCLAVSVLTDECDEARLKPVNDIQEIIDIANAADKQLVVLFKELLQVL
ncbi:MAG: purine-nucleoside phosphorylase [Sphingobacteriales bacterium]|nr:purine-nucleoside phosphorylase [Sphingobacteriales bacterium]